MGKKMYVPQKNYTNVHRNSHVPWDSLIEVELEALARTKDKLVTWNMCLFLLEQTTSFHDGRGPMY